MQSQQKHLVILGGSLAGLMAAQALLPYFEQITLVEKDELSNPMAVRAGAPQSFHVHLLLQKGIEQISTLFPQFTLKLEEAGAYAFELGYETGMLWPTGWGPRIRTGIMLRACGRPLIESILREEVLSHKKIKLLVETKINSLHIKEQKVVGLSLQDKSNNSDRLLTGDYFINCSGRFSKSEQWLGQELSQSIVDPLLGYSTLWLKNCQLPDQQKMRVVLSRPPEFNRGALLYPVEQNRFGLSLVGLSGDHPSANPDKFLQFARSLPDPVMARLIEESEWDSKIIAFKGARSVWRHYEKAQLPDNYLVMGDAYAHLNPLYGQGMTLAASCALELRNRFSKNQAQAPSLQRQLAKQVKSCWDYTTAGDFRYPLTKGTPPNAVKMAGLRYTSALTAQVPHSPWLAKQMLEVAQLKRSPYQLFSLLNMALVSYYSSRPRRHNPSSAKQFH